MALFQAVSLGLIALILAPGLLFYFDVTPKVALLLLAPALLLPFVPRAAGRHRAAAIAGLLFVLSLTASSVFSTHPALSWFGGNWRRYGAITQIAVLLFAWSVATIGNRQIILRSVTLITLAASVYGGLQYAGIDPLLPAAAYHVGEGIWTIVRPPSTFGFASYFATWLAMAVFLGLNETGRGWRRLARATSVVAAIALLLTGTRAAMLGILVGGAVWVYRRGFRVGRRAAATVGLVLLAGAVLYLSPAGLQLRSRTRWFVEDPWGGARLLLWRDSLRMGMARPLLGFGPETFTAEFPQYQSVELARAYPDFAHESPHNIFLDALVSQGLPGLILLAALLALAFRTRDPALAAALAAGVASQQFTVFTAPTALLTFVTMALAIPADAEAPASVRRWPKLVWAPVTLGLVYCAVRMTVADAALARAQTRLRAGEFAAADAAFRTSERWRLPGSTAALWYSRALFERAGRVTDRDQRIGALARSGAAAREAVESAEDPFNAWYNAAQLAAARNDPAGAEQALRAAMAASPTWFKPHWTLARLLELQGRRAEAAQEAALALRLDGGKHPEVESTLAAIVTPYPLQR